MKKRTKILIGGAAAVVAVAGVAFGIYNYNRNANTSGIPKNAIPVQLEPAHTETIRQQIVARGVVELVDIYTVYPKSQGRIAEVLVKKGDRVERGQPIIRYDSDSLDDMNNRLAEAELALKSAELGLKSALLPVVSDIELSQAEGGIIQAENSITDIQAQITQYDLNLAQMDSNISIAEKKHDNSVLLYERGVVPRTEADAAYEALKQLRDQRAVVEAQRSAAIATLKKAEEAVERAEEQYALTLAKQDDPQVANKVELQRIQVEQAKLAVSQIQNQIDEFEMEELSGYDGVILEIGVGAGEISSAAKPLVRVAEVGADNLAVKVNVPEADAVDLAEGQEVELRGSALGDNVYRGLTGRISSIAEEQVVNNSLMRVLEVEILPADDAQLRAGYTIEATIITRVADNAVVVPLMSTLSSEDGEDYVFVMRDDFSVERRVITLGSYSGMYIEALTGISEGEKIVTNPQSSLKDGDYVRPIAAIGGA